MKESKKIDVKDWDGEFNSGLIILFPQPETKEKSE